MTQAIAVPLIKRLAAIIYDLFLIIALFFVLGIIVSSITTFAFNHGQAITASHPFYLLQQFLLLFTFIACGFLFYAWFWTHGGQTLGMKTWKIRLISDNGKPVSWKQASIRFLVGLFSCAFAGLGFISAIWHRDKKTWHDHISKSHLILDDR